MLSFLRGSRSTDKADVIAGTADNGELGLAWIRRTLGAEEKLQKANAIVTTANAQTCPAVFGNNFYPPVYEPAGEEALRSRLEKEARDAVDRATQIFDDTDGWSTYGCTDGVQIYQKKQDKNLPVVLKGEYTFVTAEEAATMTDPITIDDIFQFLRNTENRGVYDTMFRDGAILRRHNASVLSYQVFNGMMGLPGREFIINGFDRHFESGDRIIIAGATPSEEALDADTMSKMGIPRKSNGLVRAHCYIVGYDITKNPDGSIKVAAISQPDLGGMIPQMIQKMVVTNHVVTLSKIQRWIKENKSLKNKSVPAPELFINHNCYLSLEKVTEYYQQAIASASQQ
ncbi:hypothetical protein TGARI_239510 [Toxoplasma gondii ARI]|uniref:START domain-containing protein n=2 Tax=Toxoplasma gondii TaxID=5811 RepID=A0A2G8YEH1_TOXGO|nr:hypothetical protein TGARI_239510 [Toxoplasma gondii ARI]PIM05662.1 hypothetical protein TGCOUG_239510 [Toxoplasma gondii COUG]